MQRFFTTNIDKKNKILDFLHKKKIKYTFTEQETFLRNYDFNGDNVELYIEKDFVYLFEWNDKMVKKEHLIAL